MIAQAAREAPSLGTNESARWAEAWGFQTLRGAMGWKLNRDGISQSEPVWAGSELVALGGGEAPCSVAAALAAAAVRLADGGARGGSRRRSWGTKFSAEWGGGGWAWGRTEGPPGRRKGGRRGRSGRKGLGLEPAKRDAAESSRSRGRKEGKGSPGGVRRLWRRIELLVFLLPRGGGAPRDHAPGPKGALWSAECLRAGADPCPAGARPRGAGAGVAPVGGCWWGPGVRSLLIRL